MVKSTLEEKFRELRTQARAPARTYLQALFDGPLPFASFESGESVGPAQVVPRALELPVERTSTAVKEEAAPAPVKVPETGPVVSEGELEKTLRSLEGYALKNSNESGQVKFAGGKLSVKSEVTQFEIRPELATTAVVEGGGQGRTDIKCAFIGHRLGAEWGEYDLHPESEQMLARMIAAMKLNSDDYVMSPFKRQIDHPAQDEHWQSLLKDLFDHRPRVVFLMGANVTATFMGKKERISKLHGQVIRRDFKLGTEVRSLNLMPIFHPEYLLINSSMKRAAWEDFQHAMELMEK